MQVVARPLDNDDSIIYGEECDDPAGAYEQVRPAGRLFLGLERLWISSVA